MDVAEKGVVKGKVPIKIIDGGDILIEFSGDLRVHGMARIAWFRARDDALVFVNGVGRRIAPDHLEVIAELCRQRQLGYDDKRRLLRTAGGPKLLRWLLSEGLFDAVGVAE